MECGKKKNKNKTRKLKTTVDKIWQDGCALGAGRITAAMTYLFQYQTVASGEMVPNACEIK